MPTNAPPQSHANLKTALATALLIPLMAPLANAGISPPQSSTPMISAQSNEPMEGHDIRFSFKAQRTPRFNIRYRARTVGIGTACAGEWCRDFPATEGRVEWTAGSRQALSPFIVPTNTDHNCEHDEPVPIVLDQPQYRPAAGTKAATVNTGWRDFCPNPHGWPCRFEATATLLNDPKDCRAKKFGE